MPRMLPFIVMTHIIWIWFRSELFYYPIFTFVQPVYEPPKKKDPYYVDWNNPPDDAYGVVK